MAESGTDKVSIPYDFILYLYRKRAGLHWSELSGEWPQPIWRTEQDLWYMDIEGQVQPILEEMNRKRAEANSHRHRS